jgi:hypothetical protein
MTPNFESFPDIKKLGTAALYITQKIHGSNAQIFVFQQEDGNLDLAVGSRSRWIAPGVVFQAEEAKWKDADPAYQKQKTDQAAAALEKYGHLLQPVRLEKLLSRDEVYIRDYPKTMGKIVNDYFADLVKEDQVTGSEVEINGIKKQLAGNIFKFVQQTVEGQNASKE